MTVIKPQGQWGVDVSHWVPVRYWDALADSGATFFAAKATEGAYTIDPSFAHHRDGFRERDEFTMGVWYHFLLCGKDPAAQAELFARTVGALQPRERICLDFEAGSYNNIDPAVLAKHGVEFLEAFFLELDAIGLAAGTRPLVYTHAASWAAIGNPAWPRAQEIDLWAARYHDPPAPPASLPAPWKEWTVWQWTDNQTGVKWPVPGVGSCDVDVLASPGSTKMQR
jgi:GH25 family lysozyme M1 (1,4-beta-N-acetylmuramidase)